MTSPEHPTLTPTRVVLVLAIAALLCGAFWWIRRPTPVAPGILFVGDSVTYMSTEELDRELRSDDPIVLARVGFRSTELVPVFEKEILRRAAKDDDQLQQVAILIGYNDVLQDRIDDQAIGRFMDGAERFDCAVWLELPEIPLREDGVARWNRLVTDAARSRPNVHVVDDWRRAVDEAAPGELITRRDGVHPTSAGAERLATIYTDAVHRVC